MRVLVIPDVHLKNWMFDAAEDLMKDKTDSFVKAFTKASTYNDIDAVIRQINSFGRDQMWQNYSPIWLRPQYGDYRMYKPRRLLQVVGHTPRHQIERKRNVISCDVFSTYKNGEAIGSQEFLLIDTKTWEYTGIHHLYKSE